MKKVLFICLGNICRSPSAEAIFNKFIEKKGLSDKYYADSAGISGWHSGEGADSRMKMHAIRRGYDLTSISRKFYPEQDFNEFDYIIGMDNQNINDLKESANSQNELDKIYKMTDFCTVFNTYNQVPDPYYGGDQGFELVIDILEDAIEGFIQFAEKQ